MSIRLRMPPSMRARAGILGPLVGLLLASVFFSSRSERFLTLENLALILQQVMVVGVLAIGQTLIILTRGIDLSCGVVMALGSLVMTKLAADWGLPIPVAILAGVTTTILFAVVNGVLVTKAALPPFIVTLGTMNVAFAVTQIYSGSRTVTNVSSSMTWLGNAFTVGGAAIAYGAVLMVVLYLATWLVLRDTAFGRHVYAVGDSPEATRLAGISPHRVLLAVYALAGVFYGVASLLAVARVGVGDPNAGQTESLDAITAVVLGGTSLFGGRGVILGTLVGVLTIGVIRNGLVLMGVSSVYQILVTGVLVILAVTFDRFSRPEGS